MADDNDDLAPPISTSPGAVRRITCEFCGCGLANSGDVLRRSARAKLLMDLEEKADAQARELDQLRATAVTLEQQLTAAKKAIETAERKSKSISW